MSRLTSSSTEPTHQLEPAPGPESDELPPALSVGRRQPGGAKCRSRRLFAVVETEKVTKPPGGAAFLTGEEKEVPCRDEVCGLYAQPVEEGHDRQLDDLRYGTGSVDHAQHAPTA